MKKDFYRRRELLGIIIFPIVMLGMLFLLMIFNIIDGAGEILTVNTVITTIASVITLYLTLYLARKRRWF